MPCYLIDEKKNLTESLSLIKKTYNVTITFAGTNTSNFYDMNIDSVSEFLSDLQSEKLICANMISKSVDGNFYTEYISALTDIYPKIFAVFGYIYRFNTGIFTVDELGNLYTTKIQTTANSLDNVFSFNVDEKIQGDFSLVSYRIELYLWS